MFRAALLGAAEEKKTGASINYIKEMWDSHTRGYFSAIKSDKLLTHVTIWIDEP